MKTDPVPGWARCRDDYLAFHRIPKDQSIVVQRRIDVPFYFGKAKAHRQTLAPCDPGSEPPYPGSRHT